MNTKGDDHPYIYLNNAATAFPRATGLSTVVARWMDRLPGEPGRSTIGGEDIVDQCRQDVASLLAFDAPERVVFTKNATEALNVAIKGIPRKNPAIVTSAAAHNSVLRPLHYLEQKKLARIHIVPCDSAGRVMVSAWKQALETHKPGLAVLTHASNVTGAVNPVEMLLGVARRMGAVTILDASQTMGLLDIDMESAQADVLVFTGHKYLLGPQGTGGMVVQEGIEIEPLLVGGSGIRSESPEMPRQLPLRLEAGTAALPLFAGFQYALRWGREYPTSLQAMVERTRRLEKELANLGARIAAVPGTRLPMVAFTLDGWEVEDAGYILEKNFNIVCRTGLHCAPLIHRFIGSTTGGNIRFSLSRFTTDAELDLTLEAMGRIIFASR
jgi:selenocysteine lyase/cysteine desulfurase